MAEVTIRHHWDRGALDVMLRSQGGSVGQNMLLRGIRVQSEAKRQITALGAVDTGRLRASLVVWQQATNEGVQTFVGTNVEYAIYVHNGTRYVRARPFLSLAIHAARI